MKIEQIVMNSDGLDLLVDASPARPIRLIRLEVWSERIIRVVCAAKEKWTEKPSLMVLPRAKQKTHWSFEEDGEKLLLSTSQMTLQVCKTSGAFTWLGHNGDLLVREPASGGKTLGPSLAKDGAFSTKLELQFAEGEAIYGLGQHQEGILNYRGHSQYLYHHNLKVAMPVILSTRGYGILFDSYSLSTFHDDPYGTYFWSEVEDALEFYFVYGPEFDQIIASLRALTGDVPMFPKWAYGYVQSKERYKTQAELVEIVQEYRQRGIPLDCIVLDWLSWPGDLWGQKTFDPERFPNPTQMMADLHTLHAHMLISVWPKFRNDGPNQVEMRQQGLLLGDGVTYDAFSPEGRALFWKQANEGLFSHGIDGWWCDSTEPWEPDWSGPVKPEPWQRLVTNTAVFKQYLDPEYINAYSLLHSLGMYEGQRAVTSEKRVVNLTRSAYPGQQRYSAITWSGDITARWETLRQQIPDGLNFTLCGNPRWTFDIGGFFVKHRDELWFWDGAFDKGCEDLGYRELFVRWFQLGAFLPMFRAHGTDTPREVWRFGNPGEVFYDTLVKFIQLRYRLMPYIYSLAGWETQRAYTMLRALAFDFRHDPEVYNINNQFMLGPSLLVCPITQPMYYGPDSTPLTNVEKSRRVYLPAGCDWYDFWSGQRYAGGQWINAAAPLEVLPLFVRAGSLLPLGPVIQYVDELPDAALELRVYPGANGQFDLYEDEGDSYRYEQGEFAWTPLAWNDSAQKLTIGPRQGSYRNMPAARQLTIVLVSEGHGIGLSVTQQSDNRVTVSNHSPVEWPE